MPTDKEILHQRFEKDPVFKGARLEVAKKLKVYAALELGEETANQIPPSQYLAFAEEAITTRQIPVPNEYTGKAFTTLEEVDKKLEAKPNAAELKKQLGGKPSELVPTVPQLNEVAKVADTSMKNATWPISVMGTSIFTLITSFFQAVGDLFTGKNSVNFGNFFSKVNEFATISTGNNVASNLESGLTDLAEKNPAIGKWLNPMAIDDVANAARKKARVIAKLDKDGPTDEEILAGMKTKQNAQQTFQQHAAGTAQRDIEQSVRAQLSRAITETVEGDKPASIVNSAREMVGFKASKKDVDNIENTAAKAVYETVANPKYEYKGNDEGLKKKLVTDKKHVSDLTKDEMAKLLTEETEKALKADGAKGFFSFKLKDDHIKVITGEISKYTNDDKNFAALKSANEQTRSEYKSKSEEKGKVAMDNVKKQALEKTLGEEFDKNSRQAIADNFGVDKNSEFVVTARKRFVEIAGAAIANDTRVLNADQEKELAAQVVKGMMADKNFAAKAFELAKNTPAAATARAMPFGSGDGLIRSGLTKQVTAGIETFFKDEKVHDRLVAAVKTPVAATKVVQNDVELPTRAPATPPKASKPAAAPAKETPEAKTPVSLAEVMQSASNVTSPFLSAFKNFSVPNKPMTVADTKEK